MSVTSNEPHSANKKQQREASGEPQNLTTIVDLSNNPCKSTKINSPRSLIALKKSNFAVEELYSISFDDFKRFPDNIPYTSDIIKSRYEFHEQNRQNKLSTIIQLRESIINDNDAQYSKKESMSQLNCNKSASEYNKSNISNGLHNERKEFERMKAKNEMDLVNMVEQEFQNELMRKKAQEKERNEKEKAEQYRQELKRKREMEEQKRKSKEQEIQRHLQEEEEARLNKEKDRYEKEQRKKRENEEKERKRLNEIERNRIELEQKNQAFQGKVNTILEENKQKVEERQRLLEMKETERQKSLEERRIIQQNENLRKQQEKKDLIDRNQQNLENQIHEIQTNYLEKERLNEIKKKEFEERQRKLNEEKQLKSQMKTEEIERILETNRQAENQRIKAYHKKQEEILIKKKELEEYLNKEREHKKMEIEKREQQTMHNIQKRDYDESCKKNQILEKIEYRHQKTKEKQEELYQDYIQRREEKNKSNILKQEKLKRISREEQNERDNIANEMNNKSKKVNDYFALQKQITEEKKNFQAEMEKKKEEYTKKFDVLFNKKSFNNKSISTLKEMFPQNNKIDVLIEEMKSPQNYRLKKKQRPADFSNQSVNYPNSKMLIKTTSNISKDKHYINNKKVLIGTNSNKTTFYSQENIKSESNPNRTQYPQVKKSKIEQRVVKQTKCPKLTEKEIVQKVNEYKVLMNNKLMKLITFEREQEVQREGVLSKMTSKKEIQKMELEFGKERSLASERIIRKNGEIEKKIREYEFDLRNAK